MYKFYFILAAAAVSFLCYVAGIFAPVVGFFILPFSSVALTALFIRQGIASGIAGSAAACLLVYGVLPSGRIFLIPYVMFVLLNSLTIYSGISAGRDKVRILIDSFAAVTAVALAFMLLLSSRGFEYSGLVGGAAAGIPADILSAVEDIFERDIYSIVAVASAVFVVLSYAYLSLLPERFGLKVEKLPAFYEWRLPEQAVFVFIAALFCYVAGKTAKAGAPLTVAENVLIFAAFAYFVNGITAGTYLFRRARFLLWIMYLFSFFYPPSAIFLGISDVWLNFRKKREGDNENNNKAGD